MVYIPLSRYILITVFGVNYMEYRKLISFGKSSFVVSLPKSWITKQKLKKGDTLYFDEKESSLVINSSPEKKSDEQKEVTIEVDGKEVKQIRREIIGAYIRNNKIINLVGNEIKEKAKEIEPILQNLVALEVMEQTSKKIVAKDFLNFDDVSTESIIRKIDIVIRAIVEDCINMFEEDSYESINHRDKDINKLVFLIFRIVKYGYENPSYMLKKFSLNTSNLSSIWWLAHHLESVADESKRIARTMRTVKLSQKEKQTYIKILNKIKCSYLSIMKAYYTNNVEDAHKVINQREAILKECEEFYLNNKSVIDTGLLIDKTKALTVHICHLGRILYQG